MLGEKIEVTIWSSWNADTREGSSLVARLGDKGPVRFEIATHDAVTESVVKHGFDANEFTGLVSGVISYAINTTPNGGETLFELVKALREQANATK